MDDGGFFGVRRLRIEGVGLSAPMIAPNLLNEREKEFR
ncbi:hypothetical protein SCOR_04850 [Sulfidibacter corallicola]